VGAGRQRTECFASVWTRYDCFDRSGLVFGSHQGVVFRKEIQKSTKTLANYYFKFPTTARILRRRRRLAPRLQQAASARIFMYASLSLADAHVTGK